MWEGATARKQMGATKMNDRRAKMQNQAENIAECQEIKTKLIPNNMWVCVCVRGCACVAKRKYDKRVCSQTKRDKQNELLLTPTQTKALTRREEKEKKERKRGEIRNGGTKDRNNIKAKKENITINQTIIHRGH